MSEETRGLSVAESREREELVVLLRLRLAEGLYKCCLKGRVLVPGWWVQDEGFDLTGGDAVESRHNVVELCDVSLSVAAE